MQKLDGVESVDVSLNEGRVRVQFAPETSVTIAQLRRTIRNQGFTPREATLTVSAQIEMRGGAPVAVVPGSGVTYTVTAGGDVLEQLSGLVGSTVVLEAQVELDQDDVTPDRMEVTRVRGGPPTAP